MDQTNRIIHRYGSDNFLVINFERKVESATVRSILNNGVLINGDEFHFIGCSSGGLKSRTCYLFKDSQSAVKRIWAECGAFSSIKSRYKRLKRIGLLFSSAIPTGIEIPLSAVTERPDIECAGHNFTDGCGAVSLELAQKLKEHCIVSEKYVPTVFQIRYQGCKGVVALDKSLKGTEFVIRPSMKKFNAGTKPFNEIWLCDYSRPYIFGNLNRQFITLLSSLGVKDEVFLRIQDEHFQLVENVTSNVEAAFQMLLFDNQTDLAMACTHPDFLNKYQSELTKLKAKALTKLEKLRLPILKSRNIFGVCDTTNTLRYGQCYCRFTDKGQFKTICGKVVVAKNPCYLLGDVRVLTAVDVEGLDHLVDCIVFPTQGERPHPAEIAGSDLDGDQYFVCWDEGLILPKVHKPYDYPSVDAIATGGEITPEVLIDFFASQRNSMGKIDAYYKYWANIKGAGCTECQTLGKLFSRSVDATKTGDAVSVPPNLIPPLVPESVIEDATGDKVCFVWEVMEKRAVEKKKQLSQEVVLQAETNVQLLTEEFIYSLLDMEIGIPNITEFQLLKLIYQWCNNQYSSSESEAHRKFKEFSMHINFGELTLEQQVSAIDFGIPLKEVTNALNHSSLSPNLVTKFSLDNPHRNWRFYFRATSADFKWRNLLHGIQSYHESLLIIKLPEEVTFVIHFRSKIKPGQTDLDSDSVVVYFSSSHFNLNLQCALGSDFKVILDEDKLQLFRESIGATFIWLSQERAPKKTRTLGTQKPPVPDTLFDRISVDLTRFKSDVLRIDNHPVVNKQCFLSIEMFVKTEPHLPAYLEYIEVDSPNDFPVEEEFASTDYVDNLPTEITAKQEHMFVDGTDHQDSSQDDVFTVLAQCASSGHLHCFLLTLKRHQTKHTPKMSDQLLTHFNELLATIVNKYGHESLIDKVEETFCKIFSSICSNKVTPVTALQLISKVAQLRLFKLMERIFVSMISRIQATEVSNYFDVIGNWEMWYYIPSSFAARLSDHFYSLFLSLCDASPNIQEATSMPSLNLTEIASDPVIKPSLKQQEADKYSLHFSHLIHSHLMCEMCSLKEKQEEHCDSVTTLVRMRCYDYVSPHADHEKEDESSSLKIGFNRPDKGISSKSFTVGSFVSISIMSRCKASLKVSSKAIAIGHVVKVSRQPADIVIEVHEPVSVCLKKCAQGGIGHWELALIGNITLYRRSLKALKEIEKNSTSSSLFPLLILTHKCVSPKLDGFKEKKLSLTAFSAKHSPQAIPDLNQNQMKAVYAALNQRLTLIHGPPGTGKTHVACAIIQEHLARTKNQPVLVVAETNMAVDNLCEKLLSRDIRVIRIGNLEHISHHVRAISVDGQIEKKRIQEGKDKKRSQFPSKTEIKPILKAAQVVAATCTSAGDPCLKGMKFPIVIVDEATQVTEPTSLIPLTYGCQQLTLIGDPEQLAPSLMIQRDSEFKVDELSVTIFHRLQKLLPHNSVFLNEQHRMHPKLVEFPSTKFYSGKLITAESRLKQKSVFQESISFIDESNPKVFVKCNERERRIGTSFCNPAEARIVADMIKCLIDFKISTQQIAVLTPYSGQLKCLQNEFETQKINHVKLHTIDSFQGREADIVIFSSVRCNSAHELGFMDDQYRINVLLTRARHCVIGIGSVETLANGSQLWKDWLSMINKKNVIEKSDLSKNKKKNDRRQQAAPISEPNQKQASISKSSFDHEAKHKVHQREAHQHRGRRAGRSHSSSNRIKRDDHDGVAYDSYRGNRRGRGRTSSDHRRTDHEDRSRYRGRHHSPQAFGSPERDHRDDFEDRSTGTRRRGKTRGHYRPADH